MVQFRSRSVTLKDHCQIKIHLSLVRAYGSCDKLPCVSILLGEATLARSSQRRCLSSGLVALTGKTLSRLARAVGISRRCSESPTKSDEHLGSYAVTTLAVLRRFCPRLSPEAPLKSKAPVSPLVWTYMCSALKYKRLPID